jgi:ribosomal protein S18 acetylase RimI-like enzyme
VEYTHRVVRVIGAWNCVLHADLDETTAASEVAAQIEHFRARGEPLQWKVYDHDEPATLPEHLSAAGFTLADTETLMMLDLERSTLDSSAPKGIVVRRLTDASELSDVAVVSQAAFGESYPRLIAEFEARLPLGTLAFYVAYDGATPVAAGRLELPRNAEFAGLYGGGTAPAYRCRGIYRSLVAARAHEAQSRGFRYLNVEAAESSKPILVRLGFMPVSVVSTWCWRPND